MIRETPTGVELDIHVIPGARKTENAGPRESFLAIRLAARPVEGAANEALVRFLSDTLDVPRRAVRILSGEHGRRKRVAVAGVTEARARAVLLQGSLA